MRTLQPQSRGPCGHPLLKSSVGVIALSMLAFSLYARGQETGARAPALPAPLCDSLQAPAGNKVAFHVYALGFQIYTWDGTKWVFVAPEATLYADAGHHGAVGRHFAGPTWQSNSGSAVVGVRVTGCTPDPDSIPWLLLVASSSHGPGIFDGVTFIQRVNTLGGKAPTNPGTVAGEQAAVPYTAEYYFYRADPSAAENNEP
ncbi:MAG TPA: DUF3455 domain-containing protein [Verrucomicrobiae bacterium]